MEKDRQRAIREFVVEAEEILEALAEDLDKAELSFEQKGRVRPDVVNKVFREMHSLKGLAGMLGFEHITDLSHDLEDLLDRLRMGKVDLHHDLFALLQDAVTLLRELTLVVSRGESDSGVDIAPMTTRVFNLLNKKEEVVSDDPMAKLTLDEGTLKCLTEYEEHRLLENLRDECAIFSVKVGFDFSDFDTRLRELTDLLNDEGEIISTLPVVDADPTQGIFFRLIYGTALNHESLKALVPYENAEIERVDQGGGQPSGGGEKKTVKPAKPAPKEAKPAPSVEQTPDLEPGPSEEIEAAAADRGIEELSRSISNTVRVDITKLDAVMSVVGELAIFKSRISEISKELFQISGFTNQAVDLAKTSRLIEKKLSELQRSVIDIRMVPIGQIFTKLGRTVRKLARELDKKINLTFYGEDTELDKMMVEEIGNPLLHIIRNAMDHGVEDRADRIKAGKPEEGQITLSAFQRGNSVVIQVEDDGKGIDPEIIRQVAIRKGLITEEDNFTKDDAMDIIFQPGFSSAESVSEISGRGVGLDVVRRNIANLKGNINLRSTLGKGSIIEIILPITLAIIQSLLVDCAGETYAIPLSSTQETFLLQNSKIQTLNQREVYYLRGATLPLVRLDKVFALKREKVHQQLEEDHHHFVIVTTVGGRTAGLVVDRLVGEQEVVIKPVGKRLGTISGIAGATELGENRCMLVLDTIGLVSSIREELEVK